MAHLQGYGVGRPSGLKLGLFLLSLGLAAYIICRPLYWQFARALAGGSFRGSCPDCVCDCQAEMASMIMKPDCDRVDPVMREELHKNSLDLLAEELKLQERVAQESQQRADITLLEVKKLVSQYQKEAEKCNAGMETCEESREKAEAALAAQKRIAILWEQRARQMGWQTHIHGKADHESLISKAGLLVQGLIKDIPHFTDAEST
eukprot:c16750_g2_i1 orf=228-842(-)